MARVKDSPLADDPSGQADLDKLRAGVEAAKGRLAEGRMDLIPEPEEPPKKKSRKTIKPRKKS